MTTKEKAVIAFSLVAFLVGFFYFFEKFFLGSWVSKEDNFELVSFFNDIKIGQSQKSVEDAFQKGNFKFLKLSSGKEGLSVNTPLKWGAGNWISIIQLKDEKVIWKRIRTEDEPKNAPEGAPKDEP